MPCIRPCFALYNIAIVGKAMSSRELRPSLYCRGSTRLESVCMLMKSSQESRLKSRITGYLFERKATAKTSTAADFSYCCDGQIIAAFFLLEGNGACSMMVEV